jgi:hypothetical protein
MTVHVDINFLFFYKKKKCHLLNWVPVLWIPPSLLIHQQHCRFSHTRIYDKPDVQGFETSLVLALALHCSPYTYKML